MLTYFLLLYTSNSIAASSELCFFFLVFVKLYRGYNEAFKLMLLKSVLHFPLNLPTVCSTRLVYSPWSAFLPSSSCKAIRTKSMQMWHRAVFSCGPLKLFVFFLWPWAKPWTIPATALNLQTGEDRKRINYLILFNHSCILWHTDTILVQ